MFIINRVRKFTGGNLKGIEIEECLIAHTIEDALDKASHIKVTQPIGNTSPYEITWSKITIE